PGAATVVQGVLEPVRAGAAVARVGVVGARYRRQRETALGTGETASARPARPAGPLRTRLPQIQGPPATEGARGFHRCRPASGNAVDTRPWPLPRAQPVSKADPGHP